jgi:hypothetical protein
MAGITLPADGGAGHAGNGIEYKGFHLTIADACKTAEVPIDDLTLTIAAGNYPCLPGVAFGSPRLFDETDLLALYVYGRLLAFGFGGLRAGEYACRVHSALRSDSDAKSIAIALVPNGGKRVVVEREQPTLSLAALPEKIEFNIPAIRQFLKRPIANGSGE